MSGHRILFMGTPEFARIALESILATSHSVIGIYTQPPRPAGRGQKERRSAVHEFALAHEIPVFCPTSLKSSDEIAAFKALAPDVAIVAAYGLILPSAILEAPRWGCLNIHASLLPRWRGAAPIERAILAGDSKTGITIMQMDEGLDTGAIVRQESIAITPKMNAGLLHDRLAELGARMIVDILAGPWPIKATPQPSQDVTYAAKITKEELRLDWKEDATQLERKVRAFYPHLCAYTLISDERIKILEAEIVTRDSEQQSVLPGTVLDSSLAIACGTGALRLLRVQRQGKSPMLATDFLRGFRIEKGERLL